jgi:hypothetical protein
MASKLYPCALVAIACERYIKDKDSIRNKNKEKWIKLFSTYTTGYSFWKQNWERDRQSTIHFLDHELYSEDADLGWLYHCECYMSDKDEDTVRKLLDMAYSKGSGYDMYLDLNEFNLIKNYYYGDNNV